MSSSQDQGYDMDFLEDPPNYLKCIFCTLVLRDPVVLIGCGHHYCSNCFEQDKSYSAYMNSKLICPLDRIVIHTSQVLKDNFMERIIKDLYVKCPLNKLGCTWTGELRNLDEHCSKCTYSKTSGAVQQMENGNCNDAQDHCATDSINQCSRIELQQELFAKEKIIANLTLQLNQSKELIYEKCKRIEDLEERLIKRELELDMKVECAEKLRAQVNEFTGVIANLEAKADKFILDFLKVEKQIKELQIVSEKPSKEQNMVDFLKIEKQIKELEISSEKPGKEQYIPQNKLDQLKSEINSTQPRQHQVKNPSLTVNPRCTFMDIDIDGEPIGRIVINLFIDNLPKTCDKFIKLCRHAMGVGYRGSRFHHISTMYCSAGKNLTPASVEFPPELCTPVEKSNAKFKKGQVTMDKTGNITTSAFCIDLKSSLSNSGDVVFGQVSEESLTVVATIRHRYKTRGHTSLQVVIRDCGVMPC